MHDSLGNAFNGANSYLRNFNVLYGDFNDDGAVSIVDAILIRNLFNSHGYSIFADLNGDGVVDVTDYNICWAQIGTHL